MKNKKITLKLVLAVIFAISSLILVGFKITENKIPNKMYAVYLKGKKIGTVKSKEEFNEYINKQEEKLKESFGVDTIHTPKGVEIKKIVTYSNKTNTNEEIYNLLVSSENFTIEGVVLKITKDNSDEGKMPEITTINLLNKELFDESIVEIIKAFIDDKEYDDFSEHYVYVFEKAKEKRGGFHLAFCYSVVERTNNRLSCSLLPYLRIRSERPITTSAVPRDRP